VLNSFDIDLPEATKQTKKENTIFFSDRVIWVNPHLPACEYKRARTYQTESKKTEREREEGELLLFSLPRRRRRRRMGEVYPYKTT
jgi:hypothetical protein